MRSSSTTISGQGLSNTKALAYPTRSHPCWFFFMPAVRNEWQVFQWRRFVHTFFAHAFVVCFLLLAFPNKMGYSTITHMLKFYEEVRGLS